MWYFKMLRDFSKDWTRLDWIAAPLVVPIATVILLLVRYWPRKKK